MPELPEVEVLRRQLADEIPGRRVVAAGSHSSAKFIAARSVVGARFSDARRRGKYLLLGLDDDRELIVHLGMSGSVSLVPPNEKTAPARPTQPAPPTQPVRPTQPAPPPDFAPTPYCRAWWLLDDDRTLILRDVRRFGRVLLTRRGDHAGLGILATMGPEPFDENLDAASFWRRTRASSQHIKTQLLSQRVIAGVGNIYADEALLVAGIRPTSRQITKTQATRLLDALRDVLHAGIVNGGTTLRDYSNLSGHGDNQNHLRCYGRAGQPCVICATTLRRSVINQRGTTWCPSCQT